MTLPNLSPGELSTISEFHKQTDNGAPEGRAVPLDPSDELHKKLIQIALKTGGKTREKYPYLHHQIDAGNHTTSARHGISIVNTAIDHDGKVSAATWQTEDRGTLYGGSNLLVLDGKRDELLAHGTDNDVQTGMLRTETDGQGIAPDSQSARIVGVNHMVDHNGILHFTAVAGSHDLHHKGEPVIKAPVKQPRHAALSYIQIAIGRDKNHPNKDADYSYTEPSNKGNPNLIVPFEGSMVLPYEIDGKPGEPIENLEFKTEIVADYADSVATTVGLNPEYTSRKSVLAHITLDPKNPRQINWSFPYDGLRVRDTKSLVYTAGPANQKLSTFYFRFSVPVRNDFASPYVFSVYSSANKSNQSYEVPDLKFWWHCLAAGTRVTMADGGEMPIEDLNNTHRVITGTHGGHLGVEATTMGYHEAHAGQAGLQGIYRLETEDGHELIATGTHPIMTPGGASMICHLVEGDRILTSGGVSIIAMCGPIDYNGTFYDITLGNAEDRAFQGRHPINSYHANGILVGDHAAMTTQADQQRFDLDYILPRINPDLRDDYASAVLDRNK